MLLGWPGWVTMLGGLGLATTAGPMFQAGREVRGTGLRWAWGWGTAALGLGLIAQVVAWGEPPESGRPGAGHWTYLSALATLAALMSVFNARRPCGGAWA